jgi:hypothetical protein
MKKTIYFLMLACLFLFLPGCSGGGGDSDTVTAPTEDVTGTYELRDFIVRYSDGTIFTEADFDSVSGSLLLGDDTFSQSVVIDDADVSDSGNYSITYTNGTSEGIINSTDSSGTLEEGSFIISDNTVTIYWGVNSDDSGRTYEEWHIWVKTSD